MNLNSSGWGTMIGWTLWVIILPLVIEIIQLVIPQNKSKYNFILILNFIYYYLYQLGESYKIKATNKEEKNDTKDLSKNNVNDF
jgi:hypothetical protein